MLYFTSVECLLTHVFRYSSGCVMLIWTDVHPATGCRGYCQVLGLGKYLSLIGLKWVI